MSIRTITVLYGGTSDEREVSLRSGRAVAAALRKAGFTVGLHDTAASDFKLAAACEGTGLVVPMLHGQSGEDGSLQQALEKLGVAYFGSGPAASARTWNKVSTKELVSEHGMLTPLWEVVDRRQFDTSPLRRHSFVLKPITGGSTIDTLIVHNPEHQQLQADRLDMLFGRHPKMLLEELIEGQELTVGVLGDMALPVILIVPPQGEDFDYDNKYNGRSQEIVDPPQVSASVQRDAQALALKVHRLTGCRHLSRTDIILTDDGAMYVLEINTIPGMTEQSLVPKMAAAAGLDMVALVQRFIELADTV